MASNMPAIRAGIATRLATATGIGNVVNTLRAAPSNAPLLYILKPRWQRIPPASQEQAIRWTFEGMLAVTTENNMQADADLDSAIINLIDVAGHDLDAGGALPDGQFLIQGGVTEYRTILGIPVLVHRFDITVIERVPYDYAL